MKRVLITGMSGTGKSAVVRELDRRGWRAIDTDWNPEWEEPAPHSDGPGWVWREDRIAALLDDEYGAALFIAACVENQGKFHDRFDHVVVLTASAELTAQRIAGRTSNDYGKTPAELEQILHHKATIEPLLLKSATLRIDTGIPLDDVVDQLVGLVSR